MKSVASVPGSRHGCGPTDKGEIHFNSEWKGTIRPIPDTVSAQLSLERDVVLWPRERFPEVIVFLFPFKRPYCD